MTSLMKFVPKKAQTAYEKLVNEGGEGYTQSTQEREISLTEKLTRAKRDLRDAELDELNYKASQLRIKIAELEAQIAAQSRGIKMRTEFIQCDTFAEAQNIAPWAAIIIAVDGGFRAFESIDDCETWERQV